MASLEYQRDGSCIVINDAGSILKVPLNSKAFMDVAIAAHIGPQEQPEPTLEEKVNQIAALLVDKKVATKEEMQAATTIDVAVEIKPV